MSRPAVFLDRDGVLNRAPVENGRPQTVTSAEMELEPGAAEACASLAEAGLPLVVVTNQPDVGRGRLQRSTVEQAHRRLGALISLTAVYTCYHDDPDNCDCRKPKPGMLLRAAAEHDLDLRRSVMVGDRWRDVEAGRAAGCATVLVDHGYDERRADAPDLVVPSLREAVDWILERTSS
ncbi:MAG TPA: HAD family hydrolase [Candidatus Dormibacteraeota bacterium]|nr:HAD family hydrolase [Candidatus Dormibacteraeota bacterium]